MMMEKKRWKSNLGKFCGTHIHVGGREREREYMDEGSKELWSPPPIQYPNAYSLL